MTTPARNFQSNQFFGIDEAGEPFTKEQISGGISNAVSDNILNQRFIYPSSQIRIAKPSGNAMEYETRNLDKGYIRNLREYTWSVRQGAGSPQICRFQFNPNGLVSTANFMSNTTHPIFQDPVMLNQPMNSMTNFAFTMHFDRSMEVNSSPTLGESGNFIKQNPWVRGNPSEVGVFHDIGALFTVIGQGLSEETLEFMLDAVEQLGGPEEDVSNAANFVARDNIGNVAFIIPLPVRIVFSSLYMVEGYVTSTTVEFLKFNSAYVPMQAAVSLSVNALYVGFAKKKTFFTHVLQSSVKEKRDQEISENNAIREAVARISARLGQITVGFTFGGLRKRPPAVNDIMPNGVFYPGTTPGNRGVRIYIGVGNTFGNTGALENLKTLFGAANVPLSQIMYQTTVSAKRKDTGAQLWATGHTVMITSVEDLSKTQDDRTTEIPRANQTNLGSATPSIVVEYKVLVTVVLGGKSYSATGSYSTGDIPVPSKRDGTKVEDFQGVAAQRAIATIGLDWARLPTPIDDDDIPGESEQKAQELSARALSVPRNFSS